MTHRCIRLTIAWLLGMGIPLVAQTKIRPAPMTNTPAGKGGVMFDTYCASCHGLDAKGDGPAASAFKGRVPDLTVLSKNNNGDFPAQRVLATLRSDSPSPGHGNAQMPVWGRLFRESGQAESEVQLRLYNLTHFLEILQVPSQKVVKPPKVELLENLSGIPADSGEAMYFALCAGCHGSVGRGDGPASPLLKGERLDLTRFSQRNGGQFPAQRILYILGNQSNVAGHGTKEMPVWGNSFRGVGEPDVVVRLRIGNLVDYLKGLQQ